MRTRFKKSQRFRVIANGVSFYTDAGQIRDGVGDFTKLNLALVHAIDALELAKEDGATGLCGAWYGYQIQLSMM